MWIATTRNIPGSPALAHYWSKSTDHGKTWTALPINDFSLNNTDNYEVQIAFSSDNGTTWSTNIRVTDQPVNRTIGPFGNNFDLWGPPALVSTNAFAVLAWDDTRNGDQLTQTQDIYAAAVQHSVIDGGTSKAVKYALAGIGGLILGPSRSPAKAEAPEFCDGASSL